MSSILSTTAFLCVLIYANCDLPTPISIYFDSWHNAAGSGTVGHPGYGRKPINGNGIRRSNFRLDVNSKPPTNHRGPLSASSLISPVFHVPCPMRRHCFFADPNQPRAWLASDRDGALSFLFSLFPLSGRDRGGSVASPRQIRAREMGCVPLGQLRVAQGVRQREIWV